MDSASDVDVFSRAYAEDRIVVTFNVDDFVPLAQDCELHCGLILLPSGRLCHARSNWRSFAPPVGAG